MAADNDGHHYHPTDAIWAGLRGGATAGGAGAIIAGAQNSLTKSNVGAMGVFTRYGGTITIFSAVGGSYQFVKAVSANLRERKDFWNATIGGLFAGSLVGLKVGTTPAFLGYSVGAGVLMGVFDYTGGSLSGPAKDSEMDLFEWKQQMRKNRRRPIEETIAELGEGRGIYAPGYEERRRILLKEKYGIDVPVKS
ncbi:hypothetical protein K3495_g658 [Podosphaera aphanis]|nr:hypothetical protein K3495_g658 [Podosphaera aphanis]